MGGEKTYTSLFLVLSTKVDSLVDFGKAIFVIILDDLAAVSLFELVHSGGRDLIKMGGHNQNRRIGSPSLCKEKGGGRE